MTLTNSLNNFFFDMQRYHKESNLFLKGVYSTFKCKNKEYDMQSLEKIQLAEDVKALCFFCNVYLCYIQEKPLNILCSIILHTTRDRRFKNNNQ